MYIAAFFYGLPKLLLLFIIIIITIIYGFIVRSLFYVMLVPHIRNLSMPGARGDVATVAKMIVWPALRPLWGASCHFTILIW